MRCGVTNGVILIASLSLLLLDGRGFAFLCYFETGLPE